MHGQDRGAGQFEVAVARLAINGFRRRNGSRMTNNVATAQINSPSFSSSQNNSRSTSRILMDFLPSLHILALLVVLRDSDSAPATWREGGRKKLCGSRVAAPFSLYSKVLFALGITIRGDVGNGAGSEG